MIALRRALSTALRRRTQRSRAVRYAFHYENVLGTSLELQLVATHADAARRAESAMLAEIDRLALILSGYDAMSELARWQATSDVDVAVSSELAEVLEAAARWRVRTGGAFDPAAVSLVELLRDAPPSSAGVGPGQPSRRRAVRDRLAELDRPLWSVDRDRGVARRLTRLTISLDALAKGYIVDRAVACARGVDGVMQLVLNVGGDLRHHGDRPLACAIADPRHPAENAPPIAVVHIHDQALATSGGYRRGFVANGVRVSHILDARTGRPAERVASASVLAPDCATADALSTAFSVMAPHESVELADSLPRIGCLLVDRDGLVTTNGAWDACALPSLQDYTPERISRAR